MDVSQEGGEVVHVVDRLRFESLAEEVTVAPVLVVIVIDVAAGDALHGHGKVVVALANEQMEVIRHEAVGVEGIVAPGRGAVRFKGLGHVVERVEETVVVFLVLEDRKTRQFRESAGIRRLGYVQVMQRLDQALRRQKYNFFLI